LSPAARVLDACSYTGGFGIHAARLGAEQVICVDFRHQPADHPALVGYGESLYLKCGFYRAVSR
jgi:23S rRNA G2069 N7-methylase RlmK/C1962 C5-methylase RlmI